MNTEMKPWGILDGIRPVKLATKLINENKSSQEAVGSFMLEYGASREKAELAVRTAETEKGIVDNMYPNGVSLYIGIPFCPTRCLYCSFISNSLKTSAKLVPEYLECLKKEIKYTADIIRENKSVIETVYIGGEHPQHSQNISLMTFLIVFIQNSTCQK